MGTLRISAARYSVAGIKPINEDACGIRVPEGPPLATKGIAAVIADGMSGAEAGKEASESAVRGFLSDYYSTPESWTVKTSAHKVLGALNRWLHGQGCHRFGSEQGLVTTLSALVLKSATAHLFHVGDTRIARLRGDEFEILTRDHRVHIAGDKTYLSRALGIGVNVEIDYRAVPVETGDLFALTSDGVHEHLSDKTLRALLRAHGAELENAARRIVETALANGSHDNLTCQLLRVEELPDQDEQDFYRRLAELPFPPPLEAGMTLDGYRILRELHASKRTQVYLALDTANEQKVILKTPSVNYQDDPDYIDRFLHEEWAGRRIHNPHVLKTLEPRGERRFLYYVTEYVEGQTLRQWMHDTPRPDLATARRLMEQIVAGVRAFHRQEMVHQDLKPENILIDSHGTVKIIDFGSTKIAGIEEIATPLARGNGVLGTLNYTAPECLRGHAGNACSDLYSLGVIAYELLTGKLPYGEEVTVRKLKKLRYTPAAHWNPDIPAWLDGALERALALDPLKRHPALSEFLHDLAQPNPALVSRKPLPLLERRPASVWRALALALLASNLLLLYLLLRR